MPPKKNVNKRCKFDLGLISSHTHNDEAEKQERRRAEAEEAKNQKPNQRDIRKIPFNQKVANMSNEELDEHFKDCLFLNMQKKITTNNAFELHLISILKRFVDEDDKKVENFCLMSQSLDASEKIYSCRVDRVYNECLKIVNGKDFKKPTEVKDEDTDIKEDSKDKEPKRKKPSVEDLLPNLRLTDAKSINRGEVEGESFYNDITTMPLGNSYYLECPLSQNGEIVFNAPLFPEGEENLTKKLIDIDNKCENYLAVYNYENIFPGYEKLHEKFSVVTSHEEKLVDVHSFIPDNCDKDGKGVDEPMDVTEIDYDQQIDIKPAVDFKAENPEVKPKKNAFDVMGMKPLVSSSLNEYSYFDESKLSLCITPAHWSLKKPKRKRMRSTITFSRKKAKRQLYIDFTQYEASYSFLGKNPKRSHLLTVNKLQSFCNNSVPTVVDDNQFVDLFIAFGRYVTLSVSLEVKLRNARIESTVLEPIVEQTSESDSGRYSNSSDGNDIVIASTSQNSLIGSSIELLPAPPKVEPLVVVYSKAPKKIDIKLLKSKIWRCIESNEECNNYEEIFSFSKVYNKLPMLLPKTEAESLTPHLAFMALLHTANDKCLDIKNAPLCDLYVSQAIAPNNN